MRRTLLALACVIVPVVAASAQVPAAGRLPGPSYDAEFFPGAAHDPAVPTPDSVLGFRLGDRPVSHAEVEAVIRAIAAKSGRVKLFEYAKSHEGRTLYYVAVSSQANIARLDAIKRDAATLADPRRVDAAGADALASSMPAIAWMAYVIHGNEMSGTDAALALLWHLAAGSDESVAAMLDHLVVLIDPLMNPDGRERCITGIRQNRTVQPAVDEQSIIHAETWPGGRTNHYLFDMNRDWIWCTQPETRGRVKAVGEWNPHYFVESHEQGELDTFLFMPPRQPINPNIPASLEKWSTTFGNDQSRALDAFGWRYFTGEWNEEWYPGYSGSWAALRGAVDNLYEQARIITDGVRRPEGTIEAYRESVHKQLVSSLANLRTLEQNRGAVVADFLKDRREVLSEDGPYAGRVFLLPGAQDHPDRTGRLLNLLSLQGIDVYQLTDDLSAGGHDWLGREFTERAFAKGTLLVPARQPLGRLATAMLELDPRMSAEFLTQERRELLRFGQSRLYDTTGWNAAMMFGIDIVEVSGVSGWAAHTKLANLQAWPGVAAGARPPDTLVPTLTGSGIPASFQPVAYLARGDDDRTLGFAARLMDRGIKVRCTNKATRLGLGDKAVSVPRGSILIFRNDNKSITAAWMPLVAAAGEAAGITLSPIGSSMGEGDLPDTGGEHFVLLEMPRIAVLTGEPMEAYNVGELWHLIDHELGLPLALINQPVDSLDLRRYNVLVIPDGLADAAWTQKIPALKAWVEAGGTLIAIGNSAAPIAAEKSGIGATRVLSDVVNKLEPYRAAIVRDWLAKTALPDPAQVWSHVPPAKLEYPWTIGEQEKIEDDEAARRDSFRELFMPTGAILAARTDDRHWLTAGCDEVLPVMYAHGPVLLNPSGGNEPILMGVFLPAAKPVPAEAARRKSEDRGKAPGAEPADSHASVVAKDAGAGTEHAMAQEPVRAERTAEGADGSAERHDGHEGLDGHEGQPAKKKDKDEDEAPKPGWLLAPPGYELRLRMSGLLWPEAADRIAHSAYCTQERVGRGQVILFASDPVFRGAARGSTRVMTNALICGPGMGASQPIRP